jgi:hypothetical protein
MMELGRRESAAGGTPNQGENLMSALPLRIFIHGLIALVPTTDPGGTKMTALLVDGRTGNPTECMTEHHPRLLFTAQQDADCISAGCDPIGGGTCNCAYDSAAGTDPLVNEKIWLEISPSPTLGTEKPASSLPGHSLPDDSREAGSFSYIANLSREPFNLKVDSKYLAPNPPTGEHMVSRMEIPYRSLTSCSLAALEDGGEANVHTMSFRTLGSASDSGDISYALAQMVVTELEVPDGGAVKLHISDFGGANEHVIPLASSTTKIFGDTVYGIELSNDPEAPLPYDHPCNDGVARHFKHFYDLAENPPTLRLVPHVRYTQFKSFAPLEPRACKDRSFDLMNRPICPMGTFNP